MPGGTLLESLKKLAEREPEKRFLGRDARWYSAAETLRTAEAAARVLSLLGLRPGDAVLLAADRSPETAILLFALRAAGALVVLHDPREESDHALAACDAQISLRACVRRTAASSFSVRISGREEVLTLGEDAGGGDPPPGDPFAPAFVIFTSGSTGKSKAVVLCENNLISNLLDSRPLGAYEESDIALGALPLNHVFGLVLLAGAAVLNYAVFFPAKTGIPELLACIEKEKITRMNGVPSLYLAMAEQSGNYDLSSLRAGFIGGSPVTAEQFARMEEALGMTLIPVYGMSECVGVSCARASDAQAVRVSGVGAVYPMNTLRILKQDGSEALQGEEGEILVRGPMRMLGYYGHPLPDDAFFPTGDLGYLDDTGVLHLSGRKKEIIIRNGNNLSSRRIEDALLRLQGVRAAAVVGLPDEKQGEVPCAMIVGDADERLLHALLPRNEWPAGILSVPALPLTASGKPDKQKIREVLLRWRNS